jgi:hypothetical protein
MPSSENSDDTYRSKFAGTSEAVCLERAAIIDRLYARAADLNAVAIAVRDAVTADNVERLNELRQQFDAIREEIIRTVCELSQHRIEHGCEI